MILIHDFETILFYTVSLLVIIGIFILILLLITPFYNEYQINVKNILNLPIIENFLLR